MTSGTRTGPCGHQDRQQRDATAFLDARIEARLDLFEADLSTYGDLADCVGELTLGILHDARQVRAGIAGPVKLADDVRMRTLARRWSDRLTDAIALYRDREQAVAIVVQLGGCLAYAAVHDAPLSRDTIARAVRSLSE
ncbi:hypothetical protein CGZ98_15520 [Enemella evansiae]|uniref:hypothetical protein n=1 Tax=Enemella evansiae TaxID=2016499 RepID=UPI000B95DFAF|nr:hypothetical protein [Enemella evansiae]OYO09165.1 hypothetical protein CGZ98_15520 [Enemella evansiae]